MEHHKYGIFEVTSDVLLLSLQPNAQTFVNKGPQGFRGRLKVH